jgi:uncharacterized protein (DUF952 family)
VTSTTDTPSMLYHVVPETHFRAQLAGSVYTPAGLRADGFVHCAFRASVIAVANDYYAGVVGHLLLLEIDPARLAAETRYEEAVPIAGGGTSHLASGSRFPHVYGPIDSEAITRVGLLGRAASGYEWPREFMSLDNVRGRWSQMDLAFPIGRFEPPPRFDAETRSVHIAELEAAPGALRATLDEFTESQLDTPYRPGGGTVRQVVHHLPDSHANAYVRFRLALTEDAPTIRPYDEALWAQLPDARTAPVEVSLTLLACLHARWVACIRALPDQSFERTFVHPELGVMSLNHQLALYAWHGRHHVAHISSLARRMGWART